MKWITRGDVTLCSPYRIVRTTYGYEVWIFSKTQSGCLGRRIESIGEAKLLAGKHKAKQAEHA